MKRARLVGLMALTVPAWSQPGRDEYLTSGRIPLYAGKYRAALGERLERPGKERLTVTGNLTFQGQTVAAVLRWELPGRFRLDRSGGGRPILVNGRGAGVGRSQSTLGAEEESLAEALAWDRSESVLYAIAAGDSPRLVGEQVMEGRPTAGAVYRGAYYDVLDVVGKSDDRAGSPVRQKRCLFDSFSGLLRRVIYRVDDVTLETVYEEWMTVEGHAFPRVTERRRNGLVTMRFEATGHVLSPRMNDGAFEAP